MFRLAASLTVFAGAVSAQPSIFSGDVINGVSFARGQASIGGTSVTLNDIPAGLSFVSGRQVNDRLPRTFCPCAVISGKANKVVTGLSGSNAPATVRVAPPEIFSWPLGAGYVLAINADGSLAAPTSTIAGIATHPARVGYTLIVLATGTGAVSPPAANGAASLDALHDTPSVPVVLIGGQQAAVPCSCLSPQFPGINQVNLVAQVVPGASIPIPFHVDSITSTDQVVISVH